MQKIKKIFKSITYVYQLLFNPESAKQNSSRQYFIFSLLLLLVFREHKTFNFMWIVCLFALKHNTCDKESNRISSAVVMISTLKVKPF